MTEKMTGNEFGENNEHTNIRHKKVQRYKESPALLQDEDDVE